MGEQAERDLVPVVFAAGTGSPEVVPVDSDVARVTLSLKAKAYSAERRSSGGTGHTHRAGAGGGA